MTHSSERLIRVVPVADREEEMPDGQIYWMVDLRGPAGRSVTRQFLVDTGASESLIPVAEARNLGLPIVGRTSVMTAANRGLMNNVPIVRAEANIEGCGYHQIDMYAVGEIYALGISAIRRCGLRIPPSS